MCGRRQESRRRTRGEEITKKPTKKGNNQGNYLKESLKEIDMVITTPSARPGPLNVYALQASRTLPAVTEAKPK